MDVSVTSDATENITADDITSGHDLGVTVRIGMKTDCFATKFLLRCSHPFLYENLMTMWGKMMITKK